MIFENTRWGPMVAKATPNGSTILMATPGPAAMNQFMYSRMPFDTATAFAPIVYIASVPSVLVVSPTLKAQSVTEFIAQMKAMPEGANFGSAGTANSGGDTSRPVAASMAAPRAGPEIINGTSTGRSWLAVKFGPLGRKCFPFPWMLHQQRRALQGLGFGRLQIHGIPSCSVKIPAIQSKDGSRDGSRPQQLTWILIPFV
jgi:hypothetical protein